MFLTPSLLSCPVFRRKIHRSRSELGRTQKAGSCDWDIKFFCLRMELLPVPSACVHPVSNNRTTSRSTGWLWILGTPLMAGGGGTFCE